MANTTKTKTVGIKNSDMPQSIKQSVEKSIPYFEKVYGAESARTMVEALSVEFLRQHEDYKPVQTANGQFLEKLPKDSAVLNGLYANLQFFGTCVSPESKSLSGARGKKSMCSETSVSEVQPSGDGELSNGKVSGDNPPNSIEAVKSLS